MRNIFNAISFPYRHFRATKINAPREQYMRLMRDVYFLENKELEPFSLEQLKNGLAPVHTKMNILSLGLHSQMAVAVGFGIVSPITIPFFAVILGAQSYFINKLIENRKTEARLYLALGQSLKAQKPLNNQRPEYAP
jgi:hypothetical protein